MKTDATIEPPAPGGVRLASKARTRGRIIAASLELFLAKGFDEVTTQQIAASAGVTQRTLFRYFERKDSILFDSIYDYVARFEELLEEAVAAGAAPYDAIEAAFRGLSRHYDANRKLFSDCYAVIERSPVLKAIERGRQMRIDHVVACAWDGRVARLFPTHEPSLRARITAGMIFGAIRPLIRAWLRGELQQPLDAYVQLGFAHLRPAIDAADTYAATVEAGARALSAD